MEKYHTAISLTEQSGGGLDKANEDSFRDYIHKNVCRYFDVLHEVLKDRPSTFPAYTNEMTEEEENEANEKYINKDVNDDEYTSEENNSGSQHEKNVNGFEILSSDSSSSDELNNENEQMLLARMLCLQFALK